VKRPALVERFPKPFWWNPNPDEPWDGDWPVLPEKADERFPELIPDFEIWREKLERPFRRLDHEACGGGGSANRKTLQAVSRSFPVGVLGGCRRIIATRRELALQGGIGHGNRLS